MKIGFVGYGSMAQALASKWKDKHTLTFSGRNTQNAAEVAARFSAASGPSSKAVQDSDVVVLATMASDTLDAIAQAGGPEAFKGKIVVDINNPVSVETFLPLTEAGKSLTDSIVETLPDAHVGKAFNMAQAKVWESDDMTFDGRTMVTLFTADDGARDTIAELIRDVGAEPLFLGGNAYAYQLEAAAAIVIQFLFAGRDPFTIFNFIQPEAKPIR